MPENSPKVTLVRCSKCGHLLPELPPYSVYCCGGCGAFLRAVTKSSVSDDLSEKSGEGSGREDDGRGIVGVDSGRDNESRIRSRVSKSPLRSRYGDPIRKSPMRGSNRGDLDGHGDPIRKSPMRETNMDDLDGHRNPTRGNMLGDFDVQNKSSGRSTGGDVRKSPLRERAYGRGKLPAFSVRGGVGEGPTRESENEQKPMGRDGRMSAVREGNVADHQEIEARDKVGAWFDHVKEEVGYTNKLVYQEESFSDWLQFKATMDQTERNRSGVSPRRRRKWHTDDPPMRFDRVKEEVGYSSKLVTQEESSSDGLDYEATAHQTELNRSRVSPRRRRKWRAEDPPMGFGMKQRAEQVGIRANHIGEECDNVHGRRRAEVPYDDWAREGDHEGTSGNRNLRVQDGYVGVSRRPRGGMEQLEAERTGFGAVPGNNEVSSVRQRYPLNSYDGPSNYHRGTYYGYDEPRNSHPHFRESINPHNVEMNRAELLHKYKELEEELHILGDIPYNQSRRGDQGIASTNRYGGLDDYVHDEFLRFRRGTPLSGPNENARIRTHRSGSPVHGPFVRGINGDDINNYFPPRFKPNEFPFHEDPYLLQMRGRTIRHQPHHHHQRSAPRRSVDSTYDPRRENLHHPTCSCSHCHADSWQARQVPASISGGYKRYPNRQTDRAPDYPDAYGNHTLNPTFPNPTPHNQSSHSRSSVDSKSDGGSSAHDRAKRVPVVNQNQQLFHPIAGGAPFVICYNCSQLLRLPKKLRAMKRQCRLQCGSCHTVMSFNFEKRSHASIQTHSRPNSTDACDVPSEVVAESDLKDIDHSSAAGIRNSESYDFNANGYTFPYTDSEPSSELEDRRLNSSEPKKRPGLSPSSSRGSKDDNFSDATVDETNAASEAEKPLMNSLLPLRPPPGSPLWDRMDNNDVFTAEKYGGKATEASSQDKGITERESSSLDNNDVFTAEKYGGNAAVPTKLETDSDEIPKTDTSQGSADASIRKDQGGNKKVSEFSFAFMERGFQDSSPSSLNTSPTKADVFVNREPITLEVVRSAEKKAGPISPGNYWYDSRAGFWGVMASCCLGIIPPFIEEFRSEMPENCSGGETCIYVNGRELHENDLDILSSRGLPRTRYKYYLVDISGKVQEADTGDFVVNIGKLAPTVERRGYGFGMQPEETHNV